MKNGILRNISWLSLGNALAKPLWLGFVLVVCVRVLGDEGYGVFTATLFLTAIANSFADWGLSRLTIREVARRPNHASRYFSNFFVLKVALSLSAVGISVGVGVALGYSGVKLTALLFAAVYTSALNLTEYCRTLYQAFERMKYVAVSVIIEKIVVIGTGIAFLLYYRTADGVLAGMALAMFLVFLLNLSWTTGRLTPIKRGLWSKRFIMQALPAAIPLGLASQFVAIYFRTDAVMVDAIVGASAAGQYGAAYRLLEASMLFSAMVITVVYPRLSRLFQERKHTDFQYIFRRSIVGLAGFGGAIALAFSLFAEPIMVLIKGDTSLAPAAAALRVLAWAAPFMAVNGLMATILSATDDQRMLAVILGCAAIFNVVLNLFLIPPYSFFGACASTLVTESFITLALAYRYYRHTHLRLRFDPTP